VTTSIRITPRQQVGVAERTVRDLLESADVRVGGSRRHDIRVHDRGFYERVLRDGRLGLGESYVDGQWDADALDEITARLIRAGMTRPLPSWRVAARVAAARLWNLQSAVRARRSVQRHYDIGNDLYRAMLGETLAYTCAYWKWAGDLDEAQRAKLDLVCRKLNLTPGMKVLDLGCGWGAFARHAAANCGVHVTGYTVSREQVALGTELCRGLPVELRLADYRAARGRYDAIVSIGLLEHVGPKNHRVYMETVDRCLAPGGRCVRPHHREQPAPGAHRRLVPPLRLSRTPPFPRSHRSARRWMGCSSPRTCTTSVRTTNARCWPGPGTSSAPGRT
jgi:cyclopropane-fatty-acyl-phospholipid synthase